MFRLPLSPQRWDNQDKRSQDKGGDEDDDDDEEEEGDGFDNDLVSYSTTPSKETGRVLTGLTRSLTREEDGSESDTIASTSTVPNTDVELNSIHGNTSDSEQYLYLDQDDDDENENHEHDARYRHPLRTPNGKFQFHSSKGNQQQQQQQQQQLTLSQSGSAVLPGPRNAASIYNGIGGGKMAIQRNCTLSFSDTSSRNNHSNSNRNSKTSSESASADASRDSQDQDSSGLEAGEHPKKTYLSFFRSPAANFSGERREAGNGKDPFQEAFGVDNRVRTPVLLNLQMQQHEQLKRERERLMAEAKMYRQKALQDAEVEKQNIALIQSRLHRTQYEQNWSDDASSLFSDGSYYRGLVSSISPTTHEPRAIATATAREKQASCRAVAPIDGERVGRNLCHPMSERNHNESDQDHDQDQTTVSVLSATSPLFGEGLVHSKATHEEQQQQYPHAAWHDDEYSVTQSGDFDDIETGATNLPDDRGRNERVLRETRSPSRRAQLNPTTSRRMSRADSATGTSFSHRPPSLCFHLSQSWKFLCRKTLLKLQCPSFLSQKRRHKQLPMSPRSRQLADLDFLLQQHRSKVEHLLLCDSSPSSYTTANGKHKSSNNNRFRKEYRGTNTLCRESGEQYDFCLILQPQEVYAFWASLLDFRVELLGQEVVDAMELSWAQLVAAAAAVTVDAAGNAPDSKFEHMDRTHSLAVKWSSSSTGDETRSHTSSSSQNNGTPDSRADREHWNESHDPSGTLDQAISSATPQTGIHRRKNRLNTTICEEDPYLVATGTSSQKLPLPGSVPQTLSSRNKSIRSLASPGLYNMADFSMVAPLAEKSSRTRKSVFERAISLGNGSDNSEMTQRRRFSIHESMAVDDVKSCQDGSSDIYATPVTQMRRRWGNHTAGQYSTPNMMSPPIRSLTRGSSIVRRPVLARPPASSTAPSSVGDAAIATSEVNDFADPNIVRMEDIANHVIPRGIAARTNGMLQFLSALKRGIVLRRHRPGHEAVFCRIISPDGGDSIQYQTIEHDDAMNAFKEQRVRYNKARHKTKEHAEDPIALTALPWSYNRGEENDENNPNHAFTVPDYVAAEQYRQKMVKKKKVNKVVTDLRTRVVGRGTIKTAEIVTVHPARHSDPRSDHGERGSVTLRRSKSEYSENYSFSVILRTAQPFLLGNPSNLDEYEDLWYKGEGNGVHFRYVDFEAATEGEYWLILRGFLLLHRDAAVGRFAEQRAAGIGSHYSRLELEQREQADLEAHNRLHKDEFNEPVTVGCLEKLVVKLRGLDTTYMEGFTLPGAVPPPSDYFLGFKSPGTAIWSRLRLAGLETQRVYGLDSRQVIIKIRCPSDRLMDVAEVLKVKLKTRAGSFAPFREDMLDLFRPFSDIMDCQPTANPEDFQFASSIRQTIINFIIGSRIRDSGAELGQTADLGKMVQARVPLHMKAKLNDIFRTWVLFWRVENWIGRDGRSLSHEPAVNMDKRDDSRYDDNDRAYADNGDFPVAGWLKRVFVGCFYQPLDSIEEYFGEKVSFYFAWLQHTATHLVFLTVAGLILFCCQLASGKVDHPLRPYFAMVNMLWTFIVLVNWRQRANFLAYRWGTMNYKEQETTRPQFRGDYAQDDITGEWIVVYPKWKRWLKYLISLPLTLFFTCGTLIMILSVHANRDLQLDQYFKVKVNNGGQYHFTFALSAIGKRAAVSQVPLTKTQLLDPTFWFIVVGMPSMLSLCLPLLNFTVMRLSTMLNDFENYRTDSEYRTHLIIKVFSVRFICNFATLYYYSFLSVGSTTAIENGILRVGTGIFLLITVASWWQIFLNVILPMLIHKVRFHLRQSRLGEELRGIELEEEEITQHARYGINDELKKRQIDLINKRLLLEQAQDDVWLEIMCPPHDSFPEYIQAVVQFGYISCFSVVLPITPLICLFNYLLCMRLDAYKLCRGRRRPLAEKTGGIGVWEHLLHIVAVVSVLTNCWLMGFTCSSLTWIGDEFGELVLFSIVVGWEHVMLLIKYILQTSISPRSKTVRDAMKKEKFELEKQRNKSMRDRQGRRTQYHRGDDLPNDDRSVPSLHARKVPGTGVDSHSEDRRQTLETIHRSATDTRSVGSVNQVHPETGPFSSDGSRCEMPTTADSPLNSNSVSTIHEEHDRILFSV